MRKLNVVGLLCLVAAPSLVMAQARGDAPAEIDPNAPAAGDPRDPQPAEPAEADDGAPGMALTISGVTDQEGALNLRGADAMKAGEGSLAVFGGRLTLGRTDGRRVVLHNHVQVGDSGRVIGSPSGTVVVDGTLDIRGASRFGLDDSTLIVNNGNFNLSENSRGRVGRGSSAMFSGESSMVIGGGSTLVVDGGSIQFGDASALIVDGSSLNIDGGNLTTSGNASFQVANGNIRIIGALDHNSVPPIQYLHSNVTINGGSFTVGDNATVEFKASNLVLRNASLETNFGLLLNGDSSTSARNSSIVVNNGGSLTIAETAILEGRNSTLTVEGGNFEFADLAKLDAACAGDVKLTSLRGKATASCVRFAYNDDDAAQCAGGFFDEASRRWKCEDTCIKSDKGGMVCGKTDHF